MKVLSRTLTALAAVFVLSIPAMAQKTDQDVNSRPLHADLHRKSMSDSAFAREAAQGGMFEVAAGKLAVQKGTSAEVTRFGQRMN